MFNLPKIYPNFTWMCHVFCSDKKTIWKEFVGFENCGLDTMNDQSVITKTIRTASLILKTHSDSISSRERVKLHYYTNRVKSKLG